jgi:hypothetical protein
MPRIELSVNGRRPRSRNARWHHVVRALAETLRASVAPKRALDQRSMPLALEKGYAGYVQSSANAPRGHATALIGAPHGIIVTRKSMIESAFFAPESRLAALRAQPMAQRDARSMAEPEPERPFDSEGFGEISLVPRAPAVANALHRCDSGRRRALLSQDLPTARHVAGQGRSPLSPTKPST